MLVRGSCLLLMTACVMCAQDVEVKQIPVRLALVCADGSRLQWPAEGAGEESLLTAERMAVKDGDTIHSLLIAAGIRPDVESFALVYELNSEVDSLDDLRAGISLMLPRLLPGDRAKRQIASGCSAALTVDAKLKEQFDAIVRALPALADRFKAGTVDAETSESLGSILDSLEFIRLGILRRNGRPLSRESLEQLNAESSLLQSIFIRAPSSGDLRQITAISRDIDVKKSRFVQVASGAAPHAWPRVRVIVHTIKDGQPVSNLRVYYVPEALRGVPDSVRPFDTLSSPTARMLPEADYVVWASSGADVTPVSNEHRLEVRRGQDIRVDLTVLR